MRQHLQDPVQALERGSSPTSSLSSSSSSDKTKLVFSECFLVTSSWDQQLFSDIACLEASQFWDFLKGFSGYSMVQQPFELAWVQTCSVFNQILVHREISTRMCWRGLSGLDSSTSSPGSRDAKCDVCSSESIMKWSSNSNSTSLSLTLRVNDFDFSKTSSNWIVTSASFNDCIMLHALR